jgi:transcriptional regulator with XRE-family HTH domain
MVGVQATLNGLKRAMSAQNEAELARRLGIKQSTISSWEQRGRVPQGFAQMVEASGVNDTRRVSVGPDTIPKEIQELSHPIALMRFALLHGDLIRNGDFDAVLPTVRNMVPFWLILHRAVYDLMTRNRELCVDPATAQALVLQEDLRAPDETRQRIEAELAEDIADNPHLKVP